MAEESIFQAQNQVRKNVQKFQEELLSIKNFEKEMKDLESNNEILRNEKDEIPIRSDLKNFQKYSNAMDSGSNTKLLQENNQEYDDIKREEIANDFKQKGNDLVKLKQYTSAIEMYSRAIELREDAVYYSNRSQCFLSLERFDETIKDATRALKLDKASSKSYYRRMIAYEKLNQKMKALQNCQEWMINMPNDQIAKNSYDRIHNEIIETEKLKEKEKIKWSRSLDATTFIDKPSHNQSNKSLKKIQVCVKKSHSPIPDEVIDKIFENNTGEHNVESTSHLDFFKPKFLEDSYINESTMNKVDKSSVNKTNEILKANDKKKDKISDLNLLRERDAFKADHYTLPNTGPQFYAEWKELSEEYRFLYLKNIAENNVQIGKLLGAQLNSEMLSDIINVIYKYFFMHNISYINLIYELSKNSELSILAIFLDHDDKEKLQKLLNVLRVDNDLSNMIHQIKQNFQISN